ncbi:hypothetical protein Bpro_3917 [Polaromonas sp. JS666]|nr:hypothetical protein Bpro_3917 [Polaromonas sp. JS666]
MRYTPVGGSLRVAPSPLAGGGACGPAKPVPRPLLAGEAGLAGPAERSKITSSMNTIFPPGRPKEKTAPEGLEPAAPKLLEQVGTGDRGEASGEPRPARPRAVHEVTSVGAMS